MSRPAKTGQDQDQERRLPLRIRVAGRVATEAIARAPGIWGLVRAPMRRFFGNAAAHWDERVKPDESDHLAPLVDAIERLGLSPERILDVGTGTGAGALWLARRFEQAEVLGIDVAPEMIERARAKVDERVRFEVADVHEAASSSRRFDLIVHLNCPVLFDDVAAALDSDGTVLVVASLDARTPFYTSHSALRRGFRRVGLAVLGEGEAGTGTWFAATRMGVARAEGIRPGGSARAHE